MAPNHQQDEFRLNFSQRKRRLFPCKESFSSAQKNEIEMLEVSLGGVTESILFDRASED